MKSFLSVVTPMRAITKFLLAFPRNHHHHHHHRSCELISTIKTSSLSLSSSIVTTNTARRSTISYLHQPTRSGTSSINRDFGRRTTAHFFSSVDHKQPSDDDDDDDDTHHRNRNNDNDNDNENNNTKNNWLVVGDGDLSYSATIAEELANKNIHLFATVLEEENDHNRIYERSMKNKEDILSYNSHHPNNKIREGDTPSSSSSQYQVLFGVDATRLEEYDFSSTTTTNSTDATTCITTKTDDNNTNNIKFQTIEFNFPHWSGKTNAKKNRQLLDDFLRSASKVLNNQNEKEEDDDDDDGDGDDDNVSEIIISLCEGQGGFPASNVEKWKQSWLVAVYAAEHGLLCRKLQSYNPIYTQTSHRGKDKPWIKDGIGQRYHFSFPRRSKNKILCPINTNLQISCRTELRIVLPNENENDDKEKQQHDATRVPSRNDIVGGDAVYNLIKEFVPDGIRMDVVAREIVSPYTYTSKSNNNIPEEVTLAIFLINYSGECIPLTRDLADSIRSKVEISVKDLWKFNIAKSGRIVSKPFPTHLLPTLIQDTKQRKSGSNNNNAE